MPTGRWRGSSRRTSWRERGRCGRGRPRAPPPRSTRRTRRRRAPAAASGSQWVGHPVQRIGGARACRYGRRDMEFGLATAAIVFGAIFLVELPDKTFIATLVLATRFRPLLRVDRRVAGVPRADRRRRPRSAACWRGCRARRSRSSRPDVPHRRHPAAARRRGQADEEEAETEEEFAHKGAATAVGLAVVIAQLHGALPRRVGRPVAAADRVAGACSYDDPVSVFVGAFLALAAVSGLAAVARPDLLTRMRLSTIRRIGGGVCLLLAAVSAAPDRRRARRLSTPAALRPSGRAGRAGPLRGVHRRADRGVVAVVWAQRDGAAEGPGQQRQGHQRAERVGVLQHPARQLAASRGG